MTIMRLMAMVLVLCCVAVTAVAGPVPPLRAPVGEMVEGIACASDPTQTYTLYLPTGFDSSKRWPVLLIFDPRGRSVLAAELFREAAETYGWILVSSDNTRSDGPMEPNVVALRALWPEVHTRIPAQFDRIYTAGFSGGAAVAYVLSRSTGEVAGILACGGRYLPDDIDGNPVAIFSTAGATDFNYHEMHAVDDALEKQGSMHRLVIFDGAHTWMPPSVAGEAVGWFEALAMKSGLREPDPKLVAELYAADLETARVHERAGRLVDAARLYREAVATYDGLCEISAAREADLRLAKNKELRRQKKELKRWKDFETAYVEHRNRFLNELRFAEIPPPPAHFVRGFRIEELQRRARQPGVEGVTAQRAINSLATNLNFYLARDLTAEGQYDRLAVCLEVGLTVREENPVGWYNLACARARLGREAAAVEALHTALEHGFTRFELMDTDPDLDPLRDREDFKALLAGR